MQSGGDAAAAVVAVLFALTVGPVILSRVFRALDGPWTPTQAEGPPPRQDEQGAPLQGHGGGGPERVEPEEGAPHVCPACGAAITPEQVRCPGCDIALR